MFQILLGNDIIATDMTTTLGTKIKKLREIKNYKQDYMAEKLGLSVNSYGRIERDEVEVSHERLEQIAKALDLSVQDILSFDEKILISFLSSNQSLGYNYSGTINNYAFSEAERKLIEDKFKLYEDKIALMQEVIDTLKAEVERLKGV